ncbi:hypothetical protein ACVWYF_004247 [Hymenobacter sp. UYAg731]
MTPAFRTLLCSLALALPAAAQAQTPAPPPGAPPAATAPNEYLLGRTYRVETTKGTTFTGSLVGLSLNGLEFESTELGHISLQRDQVRRAELQGPLNAGLKPGYYDIGNGNRLFFAPTGRGLRRGENSLQTVNLFLLGANFGITDNFSMGGYITLIPGLGLGNQFLVLTPKVSFPVSEKLHVGAGALYLRIPDFDGLLNRSYGAGILYGAATYGSADDNVTLGLGYGFFEGEIGSTPIVEIGGQKRISRRISLISENYIIADSHAGLGGLYGVKINWRRTSLGLGAFYTYGFGYNETNTSTYYPPSGPPVTTTQTSYSRGSGQSSYILPVYYDFTFRFGKAGR